MHGPPQVATAMAAMQGTNYLEKQRFLDNFWGEFRKALGPKHVIRSLAKCDFSPIHEWQMAQREAKKALPKDVRWRSLSPCMHHPLPRKAAGCWLWQ